MRKRPWLPPANDDKQHRPLDVFIWGDVFIHAQDAARTKFVKMICDGAFDVPTVTELTATGMPLMQAVRRHELAIAKMHARKKWMLGDEPYYLAAEAALQGTTLSWDQTRPLIWEHDGGVCQVCGDALERQEYECGHMIDRCVGGADRRSNLVCMCIVCHRLKPLPRHGLST